MVKVIVDVSKMGFIAIEEVLVAMRDIFKDVELQNPNVTAVNIIVTDDPNDEMFTRKKRDERRSQLHPVYGYQQFQHNYTLGTEPTTTKCNDTFKVFMNKFNKNEMIISHYPCDDNLRISQSSKLFKKDNLYILSANDMAFTENFSDNLLVHMDINYPGILHLESIRKDPMNVNYLMLFEDLKQVDTKINATFIWSQILMSFHKMNDDDKIKYFIRIVDNWFHSFSNPMKNMIDKYPDHQSWYKENCFFNDDFIPFALMSMFRQVTKLKVPSALHDSYFETLHDLLSHCKNYQIKFNGKNYFNDNVMFAGINRHTIASNQINSLNVSEKLLTSLKTTKEQLIKKFILQPDFNVSSFNCYYHYKN